MLTLDRPHDAKTQEGDGVRSVRVRVRPDGPVVNLPVGKTTIGSSPRCNIRLQQPGIQPLHCLIVQNSDSVTVRRWAGVTLLNGQLLDESVLHPGDCLQVGPVQLEVVAQDGGNALPPPVMLPAARPLTVPAAPPRPKSTILTLNETPAERPDQVRLQKSLGAARSRTRKILAALRRYRDADAELRQRIVELERQAQRTEQLAEREAAHMQSLGRLEHDYAQLQTARDQLSNDLAEVCHDRDQALRQCETLRSEIDELSERVAAQCAAVAKLEHECAQLRSQEAEASNRIAGLKVERDDARRRCELLRTEVDVLTERESTLTQQVCQYEHGIAQLQAHGPEFASQLAALHEERDSLRREHAELRSQLEASAEKESRNAEERSQLVAECAHLREESDRLRPFEQQARDAAAEQERMSSELYRALVQLAETQERDDHNAALNAAQSALDAELEKSTQQIAALQAQIDQLNGERIATAEAKKSLDRRTAELIETHQQLAFDRTALMAEVTQLREQLEPLQQQFDAERAEWRRERAAFVSQRLELVERIANLEMRLAEAQSSADASRDSLPEAPETGQRESPFALSAQKATNEQLAESAAESPVREPAVLQPTSFIERYSHMFADDAAAEVAPASQPAVPVRAEENSVRKPRNMGLVRPDSSPLPTDSDDEESVEEYMTKLLQRVRGESPLAATAPVAVRHATADFGQGPLTAPPSMAAGELESPVSLESIKRKSSMPVPHTDLEALRALANESARRAISRHATRNHRRSATTKVIVSTLAGMTSLWLMLESESWQSLQFATACVAMVAAAYWAGETFHALFRSYQAATADDTDAEIEQLAAELSSPLPIDVR